ncbi:MAG: NUDIX hydrolase [Bacteroidia bacterium]|nr:NUDIX hydrolase [Bacteroidia bacterium]
MEKEHHFIVRVYGFIVNKQEELLLAEEYHFNTFMRKLPGGGLHFGEGPLDCLKRELMEELSVQVEIGRHIHTTGSFIQSAFNAAHQVLGIYYIVDAPDELVERYREEYPAPAINGEQRFRWVKMADVSELEFTFPMDQAALAAFRSEVTI